MERKRTERKRKSEGKEAAGDQFVGGRKEKREKKERKKRKERKKEKEKKKKRRKREPDQRCMVVEPGKARNRTTLREVGVFLPRFYSTPRGRVMAYEFYPVFKRICMLCGLFVIMGQSWTKYMSSQDHRGRARHPRTE